MLNIYIIVQISSLKNGMLNFVYIKWLLERKQHEYLYAKIDIQELCLEIFRKVLL